jgi:hypothetical protein
MKAGLLGFGNTPAGASPAWKILILTSLLHGTGTKQQAGELPNGCFF